MIRLLDEQTINQIAAGEVIENPASVIKELVENAIDAKASKIDIEIRGGGFAKIRVADDGVGMSKADALLCFERHATSKLRSLVDLESILTMGFRGEALSSIGAVARVELITATEESNALCLTCEGGTLGKLQGATRAQGTTFTIRSLFFNVPARLKFQKSAAQSAVDIQKMVVKLALAHPSVEFHLSSDGKELIGTERVDADHLKQEAKRAGEVLGEGYQEGFVVRYEERGVAVRGFVGQPLQSRVNRMGQYLFVNGRFVVAPLVSFAVCDAYGTRLPERKHPIFLLYIDLHPELVDVNVHPQKKEVRFREERQVLDVVRKAVSMAILREGHAPVEPHSQPLVKGVTVEQPYRRPQLSTPSPWRMKDSPKVAKAPMGGPIAKAPLPWEEEVQKELPMMEYQWLFSFPPYSFFEELGENSKLWIVDVEAMRERVTYEEALKKISGGVGESQTLLFPLELDLSKVECMQLQERQSILHALGFDLTIQTQITVKAIPTLYNEQTAREFLMHAAVDETKTVEEIASLFSRLPKASWSGVTKEVAMKLWNMVCEGKYPQRSLDGKPFARPLSTEELGQIIQDVKAP